MNSYELSRAFWDFSFNNPHKMKPYHAAIYFFAIEHCNRLGWKKVFGFPTGMVLEAIGMKSYSSYKKYFDELVEFGFFKVHEYSKNQYSSNIIELSLNDKAHVKALDKALSKHTSKQSQSTHQSTVSINKPINNITKNNKTLFDLFIEECMNNIEWVESVRRNNGLTEKGVNMRLKTFKDHLISSGKKHDTLKSFKSHFTYWIPKNNQTKKNSDRPTDRIVL